MHRAVKPRPHHLGDAAGIVAVRLVDLRLQHRLHVPRLDTDHWQACFGECAEQPLRQRTRFQSNPLEAVGGVLQHRQQRLRFACHLHFPNDLARVIHNADAGLLDRNVQSRKMVHAALLLLMLEAVNTDLVSTISLKCSTQNLQLSTSWSADYPIFRGCSQLVDATLYLERQDGVSDDGSTISSRVYGDREDGVVGSLAARGIAESDWAGVW